MIHAVHKALGKLTKGRIYSKLESAQRYLTQLKDDNNHVGDKIERQMIAKPMSKITPEEIAAARNKAEESFLRRSTDMRQKIDQIQNNLVSDTIYQRYERIHHLWQQSGPAELWNNFLRVDLDLCQERGKRGTSFERDSSHVCFEMIALKM